MPALTYRLAAGLRPAGQETSVPRGCIAFVRQYC